MMILTTYLPVLSNNLPMYIGSFHLYGLLFIISILIFETKLILKRNLGITFLIGIVLLVIFPFTIWTNLDEWNLISQRVEFYELFTALLAYTYLRERSDYLGYAKLIHIALIFIGITMIMTIISSYIDPLYARNLIGGLLEHDIKYINKFQKLGGGSYGTAIAIMALFPILFFYYKNSHLISFSKLTILLYGILGLFALIRMQIFGNILIAFLVILLSMQGSRKYRRSMVIISFLGIVSLLIPDIFYADMFNYFAAFFDPDSELHNKFADISKFFISNDKFNETGAGGRAARYPELLIAFVNSPILGSSFSSGEYYSSAGGHLYWMNRLTIWGIFGFIIFIQIFIINIKYQKKHFINEMFQFFYILALSSVFAYGLIKNIAGREAWFMLFFVLPGLYYLPLIKHKKLINIRFR